MSDDTDQNVEEDTDISLKEDGEEGAPKKKKLAGKTLVLFVILPAFFVIFGGGGAALMLFGGGKADAEAPAPAEEEAHGDEKKDGKKKDDDHAEEGDKGASVKSATESEGNGATIQIGAPGNPSFYSMPKLIVTVNNGGGRRAQLLLQLTLEAGDPAVFDEIDAVLPRITDQYQMFLREMRVDDLVGSAGDYRIRRELLRRVNLSLYPNSVDAVLIEEFIVQ